MRTELRLLLFFLSSLWTVTAVAEEKLRLLPQQVQLYGSESSQQLLLQHVQGEELRGPVTEPVLWTSSDPAVVTVDEQGRLHPVGNGKAVVTAQAQGQKISTDVTVTHLNEPFEWSFRNHVLPVLAKSGCNMGACHGALAGKGGFRLSLRGYDPPTDYFNIVKQDRGRRIEFADPARSLFLAKPSGAIPHKGGLRFETGSLEYRILAEWIAKGASPPSSDDPAITTLRILPERVTLAKGEKQPLLVQAVYSDGRVDDVTRWVKWSSADEAVCQVNDNGQINVLGPGEGAVIAWYSSQIVMARITVPYDNQVPEETFANLQPRNFIDDHINRQLQRLNIVPSPGCSDAEFIRRVMLDTIGLLPTPEETREFLTNSDPDKRDKLIDALLARPEFVDYWTYKWSDVLMLNGALLRPEALKAYYTWIHDRVEANTPWDQFVREILTSTGSSYENGATNFYALNQSPEDMTENACQAFLGLSIGCAKCHNHPLEKWTNDQYYAMANLFARVKAKGWGGETRSGDGLRTLYVADSGDLVQPRTGKPQPPTPLDGTPLDFDDPTDRRIALANWMTSPENPYFSRSITNRIWENFFGVGLVDAVDDMRASNPSSNEELLSAAAQYLVDEKFNLKSLIKTIILSNAYQRSSQPLEGNADEHRFYSRYYPRRLMAEVIHDAVVRVTGVPTNFNFVAFPGADRQETKFYPEGTRAIQLYDSAVESYFLQTFGRNQRRITCECERSDEPSMVQVLHISNGDTINEKLSSPKGKVAELARLLSQGMSADAVIDEAYLRCLGRFPTGEERSQMLAIVNETPPAEHQVALEDLFWALISSREFMFNH